MWIQMLFEVALRIGLGDSEEAIVEANFHFESVCGGDPVDGALHFATGSWTAGLTVQIRGATKFHDSARGVLHDLLALNDVGILEPDLTAGTKAEVFGGRNFHEIILLDKEFASER